RARPLRAVAAPGRSRQARVRADYVAAPRTCRESGRHSHVAVYSNEFGPHTRRPTRRLRNHGSDRRRPHGRVYRATDTSLDREVAIKVVPDAFAQDADPPRALRARRADARGAEPFERCGDLRVRDSPVNPSLADFVERRILM